MPGQYIITEPSPSTTSYVRYGRGGAGNTFRVPSSSSTTNSRTVSSTTAAAASSSSRRFFSGKGGAGNVHEATERPAISLDEEIRRIASQEDKAVGHCGIGGAGNVYRRKASDATSVSTDDSQSTYSANTTSSSRQKLWSQVRSSFSRD